MKKIAAFIIAGWPMRILAAYIAIGVCGVLYVIALISVIGVPFALALLALPAAASLYIASELLHQLDRFARPGAAKPFSRRAAAVILPAASFVAAQTANLRLGAEARELIADDFHQTVEARIRTPALSVDRLRADERYPACNEFCLRLLISGIVREVMLTGPVDPATGPEMNAAAIVARFEPRAACDREWRFPIVPDAMARKSESSRVARATYEEARRRQENGLCLTETATRLSAADAVVAEMEVKKGRSAAGAGFDLFADTASATQLSLYRRVGGRFEERSRKTIVRYLPLAGVAAPTYINTSGLHVKVGFARFPAYLNAKDARAARSAQADFFAERTGLDVEIGAD